MPRTTSNASKSLGAGAPAPSVSVASALTLDALFGQLGEAKTRTHDIDVSEYLGDGVSFTFREPDAPALFRISTVADAVRKAHPDWPAELCQTVATLGLCHEAPATGSMNPNAFYARVAETNAMLLTHLIGSFNQAMNGGTASFDAALDEKKSD